MIMYSALHIMQWFSYILNVFNPKIRRKMFNFNILWIETNVAYTRLEVIAKQRNAQQVEFITGVKLICYFVLYYCFLHWAYPPTMAVDSISMVRIAFWFSKGLHTTLLLKLGLAICPGRSYKNHRCVSSEQSVIPNNQPTHKRHRG